MTDKKEELRRRSRRGSQRAQAPVHPDADDIAEARRAEVMSSAPDALREGSSSWDDRVRERAYAIWLAQGRPEGMEAEHWRQAETQLAEQFNDNAAGAIAETPGESVKAFGTKS